MKFPKLTPRKAARTVLDRFGGYDARPVIAPGSWQAMENLCTDQYPLLSVRPRRTAPEALDDCPAVRQEAKLAAVLGGEHPVALYEDGTLGCAGHFLQLLTAEQMLTPPQLVRMGALVYVWPQGCYADAEKLRRGAYLQAGRDYGTVAQKNELLWTNEADRSKTITLTLCDGQGAAFEDVTASDTPPESGCWIDTTETPRSLKQYSASMAAWIPVGTVCIRVDAPGIGTHLNAGGTASFVLIPPRTANQQGDDNEPLTPGMASAVDALNGRELGIEQASADSLLVRGMFTPDAGGSLSFTLASRGWGTQVPTLRAERKCPALDFTVCCGNRLWGCRYDGSVNELYASKLGDGREWNVFRGLSTDSWRASRGAEGRFTGAAVLGGNPLFFREQAVEKVFPSANGAHQTVTHALEGVQYGSDRSLAVIDDRLFYLGTNGFCVYNGTLPSPCGQALGDVRYADALAGVLGKKYVVSARTAAGWVLLTYDTERRLWCREDAVQAVWFASCAARLYLRSAEEPLLCVGTALDSDGVLWYAETGPHGLDAPQRKRVTGLTLRFRLSLGASARVLVQYRDGAPWELMAVLGGSELDSGEVPLRPRPCDHLRLRLEGVGGFALYALSYRTELMKR